MKALKFNHQLAELIRQGKKTSTWRMFDDKDLTVNDLVELIDKVDAKRPATWIKFAVARIDTIIQKRLGDITKNENEEGARSQDKKQILQQYKSYYGQQVTQDMPVKIIQFSLLRNETEHLDVNKTTHMTEIKLFADGGSRGNPGPSASGYALLTMDDHVIVKKGIYLGVTTNNQAEYQALKLGLEEAKRAHVKIVHVYMDSLLVINQMLGIFKVSNRDLWPIHDSIVALKKEFRQVSFTHVPRAMNKIADAAVNESLDVAGQNQ